MPVSVSLLQLVGIPDTRPCWPEKFEALVAKLEDKPAVRMQYGVIADWCDENGEAELAEVFRWIGRQTKLRPAQNTSHWDNQSHQTWTIYDLPDGVRTHWDIQPKLHQTIPGLLFTLHRALTLAREDAKKKLEELS